MQLEFSALGKWIPYKLAGNSHEMFCEWLYTGDEARQGLFSEQTISNCKALPGNNGPQKNITSISLMLGWAKQLDVAPPAAFIFHVSRCGSTIAAQMLAAAGNTFVFSEIPFFDDVLRTPGMQKYNDGKLLKEVIKLYSVQQNGSEKKVFIKTDSWHIMFYAEIRQMFPSVPFVLLYRNPVEVVRSHNKSAGMHCVPQIIPPSFFGIQDEVVTAEDFFNYPIKVTEKYFEAFINIAANDKNRCLLNYNQGMVNIIENIARVTGIAFNDAEWQRIKDQQQYNSKQPGMFFSPGPALHSDEEKFSNVLALYDKLETLRINKA